jgi:hypothetical protein
LLPTPVLPRHNPSRSVYGAIWYATIRVSFLCFPSGFSQHRIVFVSKSQPYLGNSTNVFNNSDFYGPVYEGLRDSMNSNGLSFSMHTGDIKSGSTLCNDLFYGRFQQLANSLNMPTTYTIGDNEWTDCHRANNGGYNPLERLAVIRSRFFNDQGVTTLGGGTPLRVLTYGIRPYLENYYFDYRGITFGQLHVPGSNNDLYDGVSQQCPPTLNALDPNCTNVNAEFRARDAANIVSVRHLFNVARLNRSPAIVLVIQADFFPDNTNATVCNAASITVANAATTLTTGFQNFIPALLTETANFAGRVLLVNGDSHIFRRCNPFRPLTNIELVTVPGSGNIGYVKTTVNPNATDIFTFQFFPSCTIVYGVYNAATDAFFSALAPGATIASPPCSINIIANLTCSQEAVIPQVVMQVRSLDGTVVQTRVERLPPYFLFGDAGPNILGGALSPGAYSIETTQPGLIMPRPLSFTLGQCVN